MGALVRCADADVLDGRIVMPARGPWVAMLRLARSTVPLGRVTIECAGGLTLVGTVRQGGVWQDVAHVEVVGGAGGLGTKVRGAYEAAQLRDPLRDLARESGETASAMIADAVLAVRLIRWTMGTASVAACLDALSAKASATLAAAVGWRVLADGAIWLGAETYPEVTLSAGAYVLDSRPEHGFHLLGCETPFITVGSSVAGVGNVREVTHWIEPARIRSWLMV